MAVTRLKTNQKTARRKISLSVKKAKPAKVGGRTTGAKKVQRALTARRTSKTTPKKATANKSR